MNDYKEIVGVGKVTLMTRVTGFEEFQYEMSDWDPWSSFVTGRHSPHVTFQCSLTCNPIDSWVVPETDPGGPLASPRWRFCGFGRGLGSNEKVEMTLSASGQIGRGLHGAHLRFLPWLCLT